MYILLRKDMELSEKDVIKVNFVACHVHLKDA
jgi:hypothetical protein